MSSPPSIAGLELLTAAEMSEADRLAAASGVAFETLMENAGRAVAEEAMTMVAPGARIAILCGPGNNGGDGFVAARHLQAAGYAVRVFSMRPRQQMQGLLAKVATAFAPDDIGIFPLQSFKADRWTLCIDAIFGSGALRPMTQPEQHVLAQYLAGVTDVPCLAVDVPSGLDATTGSVEPWTIRATRTVTFFRRKTGHVLLPGRQFCGEVAVRDIGIPESVLASIAPTTFANDAPRLDRLMPQTSGHKYTRGHAVVVSGPPASTGAARLGARGALRVGAGLVTVASPRAAFPINAAHLTAIMLISFEAPRGLAAILADQRRNAVLIGPGCGVDDATCDMVGQTLQSGAAVVLDADALTSFAVDTASTLETPSTPFGFLKPSAATDQATPQHLFDAIKASPGRGVVMTPHEGEFKRLFPGLTGSKLERTRQAAAMSGAVMVLKGPDTVIAAPDGRAAINDNAPPWLATAGSGDVLAGFVTGLLAQGMPAFEAACAAVWLHGACANSFGPGLIAEDIPEMLPKVLRPLLEQRDC
ncbi:MAG: NAD(P)H-hydrate dehydratase [Hyphomicrobiaceae bacterium]